MNVYTSVLNAGSGRKEVKMEDNDLQKAHSRGKIGTQTTKARTSMERECAKREEMLSVGRIWK